MSDAVPHDIESRYTQASDSLGSGDARGAIAAADAILGDVIGQYGEGSWESGFALWKLAQFLLAAEEAEGLEASLSGAIERFRRFPGREPMTRLDALDTLAKIYASVD